MAFHTASNSSEGKPHLIIPNMGPVDEYMRESIARTGVTRADSPRIPLLSAAAIQHGNTLVEGKDEKPVGLAVIGPDALIVENMPPIVLEPEHRYAAEFAGYASIVRSVQTAEVYRSLGLWSDIKTKRKWMRTFTNSVEVLEELLASDGGSSVVVRDTISGEETVGMPYIMLSDHRHSVAYRSARKTSTTHVTTDYIAGANHRPDLTETSALEGAQVALRQYPLETKTPAEVRKRFENIAQEVSERKLLDETADDTPMMYRKGSRVDALRRAADDFEKTWHSDAACLDDDFSKYFPPSTRRDDSGLKVTTITASVRRKLVAKGKETCESCNVRIPCLETALSIPSGMEPQGVWGGFDFDFTRARNRTVKEANAFLDAARAQKITEIATAISNLRTLRSEEEAPASP